MRWDILKCLCSRPREDLALPLGCIGSGRRCVRAHLGSPNTRGVAVKHSLHFTCTCSGWWKCVCTVGRKRTRGSLPPLPPGGGGGGAASPFFFAFLPPSPSALVTIGISDVFLLSTFFFSFLLFIKRACMCVCAVSFP